MIIEEESKTPLSAETRAVQASVRNKANKAIACEADQKDGRDLFDIISGLYWSKVYLNYNGKTIAVKVDNAKAANELSADSDAELKRFSKVHNVTKRNVGRSVIYHLPYTKQG